MLIVFALLVIASILFVTEIVPFDVTAVFVMVSLVAFQIIDVETAFSGLSSPATVTIAAMLVMSSALQKTGALRKTSALIERIAEYNRFVALLGLFITIGITSAFMNNTAIVAVFIPVVMRMAPSLRTTPSRLLMPLSFLSIMGGVCTLVGTSTNLVTSAIAEEHGAPPLGLFEQAPVGLALFAVGLIYVFLFSSRWIPERRKTNNPLDSLRRRGILDEVWSDAEREIDDAPAPTGNAIVTPETEDVEDPDSTHDDDVLVEAVLAPSGDLKGRRVRDLDREELRGGAVLALRDHGRLRRGEKLESTRLSKGQSLLMRMDRERVPQLDRDAAFVMVTDVDQKDPWRQRWTVAVGILIAVLVVALTGLVSIAVAAVGGAALTIVTRCQTNEEAYRAINWKVIVLLASIIPLGDAMENTGAATWLADHMLDITGQFGPHAVLVGLFILTGVLTNVMSNVATIVFMAPISLQAAASIGVDGRPLLMAVTFGASLSFMTPIGYQTNTLVYGPGQYRFRDFLRFGTPLTLISALVCGTLIPLVWPF